MATTKPIRSVSKTITPMGSNLILLDDGISMGKATLSDGVAAVASGLIDTAIDGLDLGTASQSDAADFATASQGSKADTAVQPDDIGTMATETASDYTKTSDLAAVATSNDYDDLSNLPTLGTGAALDAPSDPDLSNDPDKLALRGDVGSAVRAAVRARESYTGLVAGPTHIRDTKNSVNRQMNGRLAVIFAEDVTELQFVFDNRWIDTTSRPFVERDGEEAEIAASIEYPRGVIHRFKFSGSYLATLPAGGLLITDKLKVPLIPKGSRAWVRSWQDLTASGGYITYRSGFSSYPSFDLTSAEYAPSGLTDKTAGGDFDTATYPNLTSFFGPTAIIGTATQASFLALGDSRVEGHDETNDWSLDVGTLGRSIGGQGFAYINSGVSGEMASEILASGSGRIALKEYVSNVILEHGTNDLYSGGASATDLQASIEAIIDLIDKPVHIVTIEPHGTATTDDYATLDNQTPNATDNPKRIAYNALVRAGSIDGAAGYYEIADVFESERDSGKWKVLYDSNNVAVANGYTSDGTHPTTAGSRLLQDAFAIDLTQYKPVADEVPKAASLSLLKDGLSKTHYITPALLSKPGFTLGGSMSFVADTRINFLPQGLIKSFALAGHNEGAFNVWGGDSSGADNPGVGGTGTGITFYGKDHEEYAEEIKLRSMNQHPFWFKVQEDFSTNWSGIGTPTKSKGFWYMENFPLVGVDVFACRGLSVGAPSTRVRIDDADMTIGGPTGTYEINKRFNTGYLTVSGGTSATSGAAWRLYGGDTGAASTDDGAIFYSNNAQQLRYRDDLKQWDFLTTTIKQTGKTVSALPSAATAGAGARAFVTDATATTFASTVAGGGSNAVPVYSDGTNWKIG